MTYSDVFSQAERKPKQKWDSIKGVILRPVVALLTKIGATPTEVTLLAGLLGILSGLYIPYNVATAFWFLVAAIVIDGIDGSLARYQQKTSKGGAILDTFFDYVTILANALGLSAAGFVWGPAAISYSVLYALLVVFSVLRNRLGIPRNYIFRPRLLIYILFGLVAFGFGNYITIAMLASSVLLAYYVVGDFLRLRRN